MKIEGVAKFLMKRADEAQAWSWNMILLGDFNIFSLKSCRSITHPDQIETVFANDFV